MRWPRRLGHGDLDREVGEVGEELVQRRVEEPDGDRQAVHGLEDLDEVGPLERQQLVEDLLALLVGLGEDEVLDEQAAFAEEHVLGAAQADALGPEARARAASSALSALARTCIRRCRSATVMSRSTARTTSGPPSSTDMVPLEVADHGGGAHRDLAQEDLAGGAVDRDGVALAHDACRPGR